MKPRGLQVELDETVFADGQLLTADVSGWEAPGEAGGHIHGSWEVGIVLQGEEERRFEDSNFHLSAGGVWLHPGWEVHGWRHVSPNGRLLQVHFRPRLLSEVGLVEFRWRDLFIAPPRQRPLIPREAVRERLLGEAQALADELMQQRSRWLDGVRLRLLLMLLELYQTWDHRADWASSNGAEHGLSRIAPALELVYSNLSRPVSLGEAAAACGFSKSHFDQVFRRAMGVTYARFARNARLAEAARLLAHTDTSLPVIAERTGFADVSHLHHAFRQSYDCTPGEYRSPGTLHQG